MNFGRRGQRMSVSLRQRRSLPSRSLILELTDEAQLGARDKACEF